MTTEYDPHSLPVPSEDDRRVFGERLSLATAYAESLATVATVRGFIGPREVPRLWNRHLTNSALVGAMIPKGASVLDIGSGAGLPGIPLAIARPDLRVTLLEPLLKRSTYLSEVVAELDLPITVVRGRAEEKTILKELGTFDVVTSRAVAPLAKLATWSAPFVAEGGTMVALKGSSVAEECERDRDAVCAAGLSAPTPDVLRGGESVEETFVVIARRSGKAGKSGAPGRSQRRR